MREQDDGAGRTGETTGQLDYAHPLFWAPVRPPWMSPDGPPPVETSAIGRTASTLRGSAPGSSPADSEVGTASSAPTGAPVPTATHGVDQMGRALGHAPAARQNPRPLQESGTMLARALLAAEARKRRVEDATQQE